MNWIKLIFLLFISMSIYAEEFKISLSANWLFTHKNPKEPNVIWKDYLVPGSVPDIFHSSYWLKQEIFLPEDVKDKHISINLGKISDRDKVYFNGYLIGSTGDFGSTNPSAYDKTRIYKIPSYSVLPNSTNTLLVYVERFFDYEVGILSGEPVIRESDKMWREFYVKEFSKIVFYIAHFTAGAYFLLFYFAKKTQKEYLYFFFLTFFLQGYEFFRTEFKYYLGLDFVILKKIEYFLLLFPVPFYSNFIRKVLGYKANSIYLFLNYSILGISFSYFILEDIRYFDIVNKNIAQPLWVVYIFFSVYYLLLQIKNKNKESIYLFCGMVLLFFSTFSDILIERGIYNFYRTSNFSFSIFLSSMVLVLANRYIQINKQIELWNLELEKTVENRTKELLSSLHQVSELKKIQDADYFLITLLLNPLNFNSNESEHIKSYAYLKQKKTFEFRNKLYEIGGDILITSNIEIRNKKYTIFLNGDAMGKSIQGAGGAIVLGVVFGATLRRLKENYVASPEVWLKESFMELQNVFESFKGCMYVSCIVGLLEESTGVLYFFNAEHPPVVIYDGKNARYVEKRIYISKLGTPEAAEYFKIQVKQLKPGSSVFIGSDGKDDLRLLDNNGGSKIHTDESIFLRSIEESSGDIETIPEKLKSVGEITDDLSILKIEYSNNEQPEFQKNVFINKNLGLYYYKVGELDTALPYLQKYLELVPSSSAGLFILYRVYFLKGMYKESLECMERLYLRYPNNSRLLREKLVNSMLIENQKVYIK